MYYAWPVKTHTSNKFRLSQILKKSSVASSKIAEGNKVGKKNLKIDLVALSAWKKVLVYLT